MDEQQEDNQDDGGGGINLDVVRSYLAFAGRALKARKPLFIGLLVVGLALTVAVAKYLPRTYSCTTVLMTVSNAVLDSDRGPNPLTGAQGLIMRHENLEALIKDVDLKKKYWARRPALLGLKDRLIKAAFGEMDDRTLTAVLVGTLESRLVVEVEDREDTLTISVDWSDPATCAELAEAAKERFLKIRHKAEISAFQEKMAILDTHASKMREEIDTLAAQIKADLQGKQQQRAAEVSKAVAAGKPPPVAMPRIVAPSKPVTDEQLPELRERLTSLKARLSGAENDRQARMRDEQGKLAELKLRFTPNHPQVITQEERVGMASQVSSELALMRSEVGDLESQIRQREAMMKTGSAAGTAGGVARAVAADAPTAQALPYDILSLLDEKDADPAMSAQISGAVVRYGSLRDDVRGAKLALDTAQAAFNHRYQVVIPVEAPSKPIKPKVPMVVGIGFFLSLLVALLVPIILELRRDVLVERWQVDHFQLPVLAELRLPEKREE
jgi:uncharacterized protein involved in exopolysaccharide biosynthesis